MPPRQESPVDRCNATIRKLQDAPAIISSVRLGLDSIEATTRNGNIILAQASQTLGAVRASNIEALDLLQDLQPQMTAFQNQCDGYRDYRDRYVTLQQRWEDAQGALRNAAQRTTDLQRANAVLHADLQQVRDQLRSTNNLQQRAAQLQDELTRVKNDHRRTADLLEQSREDLEQYQHHLDERDRTINELKARIRTQNRESGGSLRPPISPTTNIGTSFDSGFSEVFGSTEPGQRFQQSLARRSIQAGEDEYNRRNYARANESFKDAQAKIQAFPSPIRGTFDLVRLAYYRAVCDAETGSPREAERALNAFLESRDGASDTQKAHVKLLLGQAYVRLGERHKAYEAACDAGGIYGELEPYSNNYLNAVALVVRIDHLQGKDREAAAIINEFSDEQREYIESKYRDLRFPASTALPVRTNNLAATHTTGGQRQGPSTVVSGPSSSSQRTIRRAQVERLPWIFRQALR